MPIAHLQDRGVVRVSGEDAKSFLDGLLTCDLDKVTPQAARLGALLTPQGKILFDFIVFAGPRGGRWRLLPRRRPCLCGRTSPSASASTSCAPRSRSRTSRIASRSSPALPARRVRRTTSASSSTIRACRRSAGAPSSRPRTLPSSRRRATARGLPRPPHRARRAGRRTRFPLRRRLPARGPDGPAPRRRFRQGLLCRPGGRLAHAAPRHRAHAARARRYLDGRRRAEPGARSRPATGSSAAPAPAPTGRGLAMIRLDRAQDALAAGKTIRRRRACAAAEESPAGDVDRA